MDRLRAENRQLEQALEQRLAECKEEAQAKVANELQELKNKAAALEQENARLVKQMHGLGKATAEADDARLVAEQTLKDAEVKFAGQLKGLKQQVRELKWQLQLNKRPRSLDDGEAV